MKPNSRIALPFALLASLIALSGCQSHEEDAARIKAAYDLEHQQSQVENDKLAVHSEELQLDIDKSEHHPNDGTALLKAKMTLQGDETLLRTMQNVPVSSK